MAQHWPSYLVCTILFVACHYASSLVPKFDNETDHHALLSFKSMLSSDSRETLASWNNSAHFCRWPGISCGKRHPQRVVTLALGSCGLSGSISPAVANLSFLRAMNLSNNQFLGIIPQEFGRLFRLQYLNLQNNSLEGGIPATLSRCLQLQIIGIGNNMLTGEIPFLLTNISSLSVLSLYANQLSGNIPATIGNLYSLTYLSLHNNYLSGTIPPSIGKLSKLICLSIGRNQLTGAIPSHLSNMSSLSVLTLDENSLSGSLPANIGQLLPSIEKINLHHNQLSGSIPNSLSNSSSLQLIQLSFNMFSGTIPPVFGNLQNIKYINLAGNLLEAKDAKEWSFFDDLTNCTSLSTVQLTFNNLSGVFPHSARNLSKDLDMLALGDNQISGNIPPEIGNLVGLTILDLGPNSLTGSIPASIGMLQNLHILDFVYNKLSGEIPPTLGNLTQLNLLFLSDNELSGKILANLGNCQNLNLLDLDSNKFTGEIPKEIFDISSIYSIHLEFNSLTGPIPSEIGKLKNLGSFYASMNKLSGELPSSLAKCQVLEQLLLRGNLFRGTIPLSLSSLRGIQQLDLSQNNLSGRIPDFLQDFHVLSYLNLSFNNFEGAVPRHGVFANITAVSILGNNDLCGGNLEMNLTDCPIQSPSRTYNSRLLILIISIASSSVFLFMLFCSLVACFWMRKCRRKHPTSTSMKGQERISYAELVRATNGFSEDNLIGSGGISRVYKGILHDDNRTEVVAVKVLNLQLQGASKSFVAECEAMRNTRHRNLLKILTICSSTDYRGNEFKALILEFMANGSLNDWLHPKENEQCERKVLTITQRLNIAIDVATALDYLHHYGESPIIHCDLKPSNILLDADMMAHVGDFGLTRILKNVASKSSQYSTTSVGLKGTIGYVPPEYGVANRVSTQGDVYSYGILLLEMFTARRPTDGIFMDGLSLQKFVEMAFPQRVTDVIDVQLLAGDGEDTDDGRSMNGSRAAECIASVLQIGISCSDEIPEKRLEMGEVLRELHNIRECLLN